MVRVGGVQSSRSGGDARAHHQSAHLGLGASMPLGARAHTLTPPLATQQTQQLESVVPPIRPGRMEPLPERFSWGADETDWVRRLFAALPVVGVER